MRRPLSVLGPLFWQERDRIGRRPSFYLMRVAVPLLLLGLLYSMHPTGTRLTPREQARFAESVFWSVMAVQYLVVWLLTPSFSAAVLTEEREGQTLDLLLTTTLTDRELVVGKLFARLAVVGLTILAGMPVVAILQLYGGVTTELLVFAYLGLFANLFGVGGASAGIAAHCRSYRAAFYTSVTVLFAASVVPVFGPWVLLIRAGGGQDVAVWQLVGFLGSNAVVGMAGIVSALTAVAPMRTANEKRIAPPKRARVVAVSPGRMRYTPVPTTVAPPTKKPGVPATIDWKSPPGECPGPSPRQTNIGLFFVAAAVGLAVGLSYFDGPIRSQVYSNSRANQTGFVPELTLWLIPTAVIAAVSTAGLVTREREADTLRMLLTVPPERAELLWRKLVPALYPAGTMAGLTAVGMGFYLVFWDDRAWWFVYVAMSTLVAVAAGTLGLFVSVVSRTTVMAQLTAVLVGLAMPAVVPFLAFVTDGSWRYVVAGYLAGLAVITGLAWRFAVRVFDQVH